MNLQMNYKLRIILLILVWIIVTVVVSIGAIWYGYNRSVENAERTIHAALVEADAMVPQLMEDEQSIRDNYEHSRAGQTQMVPILQKYGLEEAVPSKAHMKKYAELLEAEWLAVKDQDGNVLVSTGKEKRGEMQRLQTGDGAGSTTEWLATAHALTEEADRTTLIITDLEDGYQLYCQVDNIGINNEEDRTFSWRTTLQNMILADDAYYFAISASDHTVLAHPDKELVGKTVEELGYASMDAFLQQYQKPDKDGVVMIRSDILEHGKMSDKGLGIAGWGSGYINTAGLYIFCTVPTNASMRYMLQQYGMLILFWLGALLVLCYILFHFNDEKHGRRRDAVSDTAKAGAAKACATDDPHAPGNQGDLIGYRFGCYYDRPWARRLIVCCIIVLAGTLLLSAHIQLLNNDAQARIQKSQTQQLTEKIKKQNDERRDSLDEWYNLYNEQTAKVAAYVITRDKTIQTRSAAKEIADRMDLIDIFLFDKKGRTRVTNSNYDHLDLYQMKNSRMSRTLLPLLEGQRAAASTPYTEHDLNEEEAAALAPSDLDKLYRDDVADEEIWAYAGVSVRNGQDLCDGCVAITTLPHLELLTLELSLPDMYEDALALAKGTNDGEKPVLSAAQLRLLRYLLLDTALCLLLFFCIGALCPEGRRRKLSAVAETGQPADAPSVGSTGTEPASSAGKDAPAFAGTETKSADPAEGIGFTDWIGALTRQDETYFFERWQRRRIPLRERSAEQKLLFMLRGILLAVFLVIAFAYFSGGVFLAGYSPMQDLLRGGWEKGVNLYSITASAMIIIVAIVLCAALHQLVFLIARFSTPRGETICHLVYSVITYAAVLIALYYCLSMFGVQTKTLLASAGILGIVISFGAQKTIADILSGMFLIFEDAVHVGDWISVGDTQGMVKSIGVRMTKIESYGVTISINNADLVNLHNFSKGNALALLKCPLYVDYNNDITHVEEVIAREMPVITERLKETGYITSDVWCRGPREFGETGIMLKFNVYCHSDRYSIVQPRLNAELLRMCARNGIKTAFPHTIVEFGDNAEHKTADNKA